MRRLGLIAAGLVAAAALTLAQQGTQNERQQALVKSLIDANTREQKEVRVEQYAQLLTELQQGRLLSPTRQQEILREVEGRLKPVPIIGGNLSPQLTQGAVAQYQALTSDQQAMLLERAKSIAQIEIAVSGLFLPRGTGFVVGDDLIATNCHVMSSIVNQPEGGAMTMRPGVRAHFADGPDHDTSREFMITEVVGVPAALGVDVAVLRISRRSVDGQHELPSRIPFHATQLRADWPADRGLPVALVGYPRISTSIETNYRELRRLGRFGKIYSPGAVMEVVTEQGVELLNHVAGTTEGSSGSPLFTIDRFEVVGVHHCCTSAGTPAPATLSCAQIVRSASGRNHAISAHAIRSNKELSTAIRF